MFNPEKSKILLLDINSCFATIEQQANPLLRNRPLVVAAFSSPRGCILASSIEAKRLGIKTGMRVFEAKEIYRDLTVLTPDPQKYRYIHNKLYELLLKYSPVVEPKSIDEFIIEPVANSIYDIACQIKQRIKKEIGDYITVSIGIAPNRYLAKIAAGLIKPDGLVEINKNNFLKIFSALNLKDLTGVKTGNEKRFNNLGIFTVMDLYNYTKPIYGSYWYLRLRGYEVDLPAGRQETKKSFGNEVSLKITPETNIKALIARLFEKAGFRARNHGFKARREEFFVSDRKIAVRLYDLIDKKNLQLDFFGSNIKKEKIETACDLINQKLGNFVVGSARGFGSGDKIKDRISFQNLS